VIYRIGRAFVWAVIGGVVAAGSGIVGFLGFAGLAGATLFAIVGGLLGFFFKLDLPLDLRQLKRYFVGRNR
jgi:hypothetical protein